jgi:hypothetical protein
MKWAEVDRVTKEPHNGWSVAGRLLRLAPGAVTIEALPEGPRAAHLSKGQERPWRRG